VSRRQAQKHEWTPEPPAEEPPITWWDSGWQGRPGRLDTVRSLRHRGNAGLCPFCR